tara:strand:+ start:150681 stop:151700 length:1020 start_codon:yes stop_codon:yes gene_type:complete
MKVYIQLVLFLLVASFAPAMAQQTCLSYKQMGDSSCQGGAAAVSETLIEEVKEEEVEKEVVKNAPEPAKIEEETLDTRIDEYMETYNKPPREFVAFNLEPTLENALTWAKKYKELMERNHKLTAAWGQAQTILQDMESKGQQVPGYQPMPEIPDYGSALPQSFNTFGGNLPSQRNDYAGIATKSNINQGAPTLGFAQNDPVPSPFTAERGSQAITTGAQAFAGGSLTSHANGPVDISYYFSAECPFCKKFEAGFKSLIAELGSHINVICVDMTPSTRTKENINGKIDCSWRAAVPGEASAFGVTSTPTLLIDRGAGKGLEKIEGVVDMDKLKSFLMEGR